MSLEQAAIAANRFGLGARPGDLQATSGDPRGWLLEQLQPEPSPPAAFAALPATAEAAGEFTKWLASIGLTPDAPALTGKTLAAKGGDGPAMGVEASYIRHFIPGYAAGVAARHQVATTSERPFFERLSRFWANHFTVSAAKADIIALAPLFERDAVRPHVCGRFADMLLASCRHPAMLIYLDNYLSVGPNSPLAHHPEVLPPYLRERMKGLNENLGREILELHTLGVRSGYTQADVTNLARIITGWSIYGPRDRPADGRLFHFIAFAHEPGPQTLLGRTYAAGGEAQGEAALRNLARHPATARHVATKLARHVIADDPPPAAVERIATAFRDSDGDLAATARALVDSPEAWTPRPAKLKPPEDYIVSTVRALGGPPLTGVQLLALLDRMGQRPFWAPRPDGWADAEPAWIGADAVWKRVEWANILATGRAAATDDPVAIAQAALGPGLGPETLSAVKNAETPAQGLALFLASPEFQRR